MRPDFWAGRRVLLTGHTGFKGAWAAVMLSDMGAEVSGVALAPEGESNLWSAVRHGVHAREDILDIADRHRVADACQRARPQIVLHMAAQAQVRQGYGQPRATFETNVMGTVNLLDALREAEGLEAVLVVTSDKVYRNDGSGGPFDEASPLGGSDPYSASKAAAEAAVQAYGASYFAPRGIPLATARGGNVVGGGDFSSDRLVPDIFRAACAGEAVELRYPDARRPWQHVLDCLAGYLGYVEHLCSRGSNAPATLNFGPDEGADITVAAVAEEMRRHFGGMQAWRPARGPAPPEKQALRLHNQAARRTLGWVPKLDIAATIAWTAEWYSAYRAGKPPLDLVRDQIRRFSAL